MWGRTGMDGLSAVCVCVGIQAILGRGEGLLSVLRQEFVSNLASLGGLYLSRSQCAGMTSSEALKTRVWGALL